MKALSLGTLPSFEEFAEAVESESEVYDIHANHSDGCHLDDVLDDVLHLEHVGTMDAQTGKVVYRFDAEGLYNLCDALIYAAEFGALESEADDHTRWAEAFCSDILYPLGFQCG